MISVTVERAFDYYVGQNLTDPETFTGAMNFYNITSLGYVMEGIIAFSLPFTIIP